MQSNKGHQFSKVSDRPQITDLGSLVSTRPWHVLFKEKKYTDARQKLYLYRNKDTIYIKFLIRNHVNKGNEVLQMLEEKWNDKPRILYPTLITFKEMK